MENTLWKHTVETHRGNTLWKHIAETPHPPQTPYHPTGGVIGIYSCESGPVHYMHGSKLTTGEVAAAFVDPKRDFVSWRNSVG